ncbi:hypothetical protein TrST_g105 [Triparma strigata]|uniref:Cullin family profile domain-containing protein n=1 Tax=Triparma strigata TaxID=1606541 RepID=A0A9W7A5M7_9STRA|nr:hypothetical protein TrST_g105 [Triparma strigata]
MSSASSFGGRGSSNVGSSSSAKKKFVIKPYRSAPQVDRASALETWSNLRRAIEEIYNQDASLLSFEELYRSAYNLVLHKHGEVLYTGVQSCVESHLTGVGETVSKSPDASVMKNVSAAWEDHDLKMTMVRDSICMYMDRTYVKQQKKKPIHEVGLQAFREKIWERKDIRGRVERVLLGEVAREREGELVEKDIIRSVLVMLIKIGGEGEGGVYERDFEKMFLEGTKEFYRRESQEYLTKNSAPDYVRKAEERLLHERNRIANYLHLTTGPKLMGIVENELITTHARALVEMDNSGVVTMLENDKVTELMNMYNLFKLVPSTVDILRDAVCDHVKRKGKQLVQDQERVKDPVKFVRGVLEMRDRYDQVVEKAFDGEKKAGKKVKEAFEHFINADSRSANYLAVYVDELMRSGLKGCGEQEADERLDKAVTIFRYLQDKDVFESFYKTSLAKRLLGGKSVSDECEKSMVAKLKAECGYQYTSKLEGMFNDMRISKDTMKGYKDEVRGGKSTGEVEGDGVEIDVDVLTTGYWPSQGDPQCHLPEPVTNAIGKFEQYYLKTHSGRKLAWQTSLGTAEIKACFEGRRHELIVSTYQMCILALFDGRGEKPLALAEIKQISGIPDNELRRHLISLCTPKHKILKKASKGKAISDDDSFTVNSGFTSKLKRVKAVEEDRRHLLEAAIVRIMKARKTLKHNDLIAEVSRQLTARFVPDPQSVKKRIESLIEREYLERSQDDRKVYSYLA